MILFVFIAFNKYNCRKSSTTSLFFLKRPEPNRGRTKSQCKVGIHGYFVPFFLNRTLSSKVSKTGLRECRVVDLPNIPGYSSLTTTGTNSLLRKIASLALCHRENCIAATPANDIYFCKKRNYFAASDKDVKHK